MGTIQSPDSDSRRVPKYATERYLNRELSWLRFNERVLEEAINPENPLLERLKFLAIFESNLDEFYMVRVSGLIEQFESGVLDTSPDGLTPNDQLLMISKVAEPMRQRAATVLSDDIMPKLDDHGIQIRSVASLSERQRRDMHQFFNQQVFPLCTPLMLHPAVSVPFISNRSLNLCVELVDERGDARLARVKVPTVIPRAIRLGKRKNEFILLEDLIASEIDSLFPEVEIRGVHQFRVIRDADVEIRELEAADLISNIKETLRLRRFGDPVLCMIQPDMPVRVRHQLRDLLELDDEDIFSINGILGMEVLWELTRVDKPTLRFPAHIPYLNEALATPAAILETISQSDVLIHHPYDSFRTVEEFVGSAARDPNVIGIKQTLYRVGKESPIVESLSDAAEEGKQVAAMVELKARFDESNNLGWAKSLERAGVHVSYGFPEFKTHCKLGLIVRREGDKLRQYAHIGTGNYNPATARLYTDLGFFTSDEDICHDVSELFNYLTGFSRQTKYRKILVAPLNLREGIISRIKREIRNARADLPARIALKLNALVDPEIVDALYEASNANVRVDLIVRGVCCLRPSVPGLSENIQVRSIVGRFLEHSRIYYFENGGKPEALIGSADAMRRNLDRRIEVVAPIENQKLVHLVEKRLLEPCLKDNVRAWELRSDGAYQRVNDGHEQFDSQAWFIANPLSKFQF